MTRTDSAASACSLPSPDLREAAARRNVAGLGQVYTPDVVVEAMLALRRRSGRVLEPACGNGAFSLRLSGCVAVEADPREAPVGSLVMDFFAYPQAETFATIIGNPPYVRARDIRPETRTLLDSALLDQRANLYLHFIEKCVRHLEPGGELIFITPRDFLKATGAVALNRWLYQEGSITDVIDLGDAKVFTGALPNCLIWRYERGCRERRVSFRSIRVGARWAEDLARAEASPRQLMECGGHLLFVDPDFGQAGDAPHRLGDWFSVRVGAVSGADDVYADATQGNREFVHAGTCRSGQTRTMIWCEPGEPPPPALLPHRERLISRRIRVFGEDNWWHWGRGYPLIPGPRIYVNNKTRDKRPFFIHPCPHYDGAVLTLFPRAEVDETTLVALCEALNDLDWDGLGFVCDGRHLFAQRALEQAPMPAAFLQSFSRLLPQEGKGL